MLPKLTAALLLVGLLASSQAVAQPLSPSDNVRNLQTLSASATFVMLEFDQRGDAGRRLLYRGPLIGFHHSSPGHALSVQYGNWPRGASQVESGDFLDVTAMLWGRWSPLETLSEGATRAYIPIGLYLNYRRVQGEMTDPDTPQGTARTLEFDVFAIGLGAGLALEQSVGERFLIRARSTPVFGLGERRILTGSMLSNPTYLIDTDVDVHLRDVFSNFGLTVGYSFRAQVWRLGELPFQDANDSGTVVYDGVQHHVRLGINW